MKISLFYTGPGWGHKMRTQAIKEALQKSNIQTSHQLLSAGKNYDLSNTDAVVIDTHEDVSEIFQFCRQEGIKTVLIDNISPARLLADLVVYPGGHYVGLDKLDWSQFHGIRLEGIKYFPLRKVFLNKRPKKSKRKKQILVSFGGTDPNQLNEWVTKIIKRTLPEYSVATKTNDMSGNNLVQAMATSTLGITAFGVTLYEMMYMKLPQAILYNFKNDKPQVEQYLYLDSAINLGYHKETTDEDLYKKIQHLLKAPSKISKMRKSCRLFDGKGGKRIANIIKQNRTSKFDNLLLYI